MHNPAQFFANKKVTVMGIAPDGRGLQDAVFLAEAGAAVIATDLAEVEEIQESADALSQYDNVELVLGEHRAQDFVYRDFIIRAASAPRDSTYLQKARENNVPIEIDETLFLKYAPAVTVVGVTGTRGKSTVAHMITHILTSAGQRVHLGGNVRGTAMLPKLPEIEEGDVVVLELSSWQLQGFGEQKISPDIAIFTTFMEDHLDYYADDPADDESRKVGLQRYFEDKSQIYRHQQADDTLIVGGGVADYIGDTHSFIAVTADNLPRDWQPGIVGEHNRLNAALATTAAHEMGITEMVIKDAVEGFSGVEGRLEFVTDIKGVAVYNDNNATTPDATIAGIRAVADKGPITLICGGADKHLDFSELANVIRNSVKHTILLSGSATEHLKDYLDEADILVEYSDLEKAVLRGLEVTDPGGVLLFSPAAASFDNFSNEYERNDRFKKLIDMHDE